MRRTLFLTKEEFLNEYHTKRMTQKEMSIKHDVSKSAVLRLQKKYNIEALDDWMRRYPAHMTQVQKEVLYGNILGDGCLYHFPSESHSRLIVSHSLSQKEYAELNFKIWKPFIRQHTLTKRTRGSRTMFEFSTGGHPEFEEVRKEFYCGTVKTICIGILNKLTPISLAVWFQDDGSRCKNRGLAIHTNCFKLTEVELACSWFLSAYGIICNPQKRAENQWVIFFSSKTSEKFAEIILPYMLPSMRYKLEGVFLKNPQRLDAVPFMSTILIPQTEDIV